MTHDPMHNVEGLSGALYDGSLGPCRLCEFAAKVRADERAKYVLPDLPRGGEHVDWCRDLACYGCEEIADGVIAQML